jgi:hypothetical protein
MGREIWVAQEHLVERAREDKELKLQNPQSLILVEEGVERGQTQVQVLMFLAVEAVQARILRIIILLLLLHIPMV